MAEDEDLEVLGAVVFATGADETGGTRTTRGNSIGAAYDAV